MVSVRTRVWIPFIEMVFACESVLSCSVLSELSSINQHEGATFFPCCIVITWIQPARHHNRFSERRSLCVQHTKSLMSRMLSHPRVPANHLDVDSESPRSGLHINDWTTTMLLVISKSGIETVELMKGETLCPCLG